MNNNNRNDRTFEVSFTRSASRDAIELMHNDIDTFDFFVKRIAKSNKLDLCNLPEVVVAIDILKMQITYN
jgi:hypothetical protein